MLSQTWSVRGRRRGPGPVAKGGQRKPPAPRAPIPAPGHHPPSGTEKSVGAPADGDQPSQQQRNDRTSRRVEAQRRTRGQEQRPGLEQKALGRPKARSDMMGTSGRSATEDGTNGGAGAGARPGIQEGEHVEPSRIGEGRR